MKQHLREAGRLGLGGARANLLPALALWTVGVALVLAYTHLPPITSALDQVGHWKLTYAPWFAIFSTALFGSLVPTFIQRILVPKSRPPSGRQVILLMLFWAIHGWQIDLLYRGQAVIFGDGTDVATIIKKTMIDQFVWCPFLAIPQTIFGYLFAEKNGSLVACREALRHKGFLERAIPLLIATWAVWIPAVSLIYLFPPALQLPLMNIILALWGLILVFFAKHA